MDKWQSSPKVNILNFNSGVKCPFKEGQVEMQFKIIRTADLTYLDQSF